METLSVGKMKCSQDGQSALREVPNREEPENPITDNEECELDDMIEENSTKEPTLEVKEASKRLQNGKAPGIDSITAVTEDKLSFQLRNTSTG